MAGVRMISGAHLMIFIDIVFMIQDLGGILNLWVQMKPFMDADTARSPEHIYSMIDYNHKL